MTRWQLLNLPVHLGEAPEPWGTVAALWFLWEERRVDRVGIISRWRRRWEMPLGPGVRLDWSGVWIADATVLWPASARVWRVRRRLDRQGWVLANPGGEVLGLLKDVAFDPDSGAMSWLWLSRGRLADVLHGMVSVPASAVSEDGSSISWLSTGDAVR